MSHGKKFDEYLILNIEPRIWRVSERERERDATRIRTWNKCVMKN